MSKALERLYAQVPALECKGLCQECCGPIRMGPAEAKRTGHPNDGDLVGDLAAYCAGADLTCPLLTPMGTCSVYERRPMVCRLWGVVESMPCPHGCKPERWLSHEEGGRLLRAANAVRS